MKNAPEGPLPKNASADSAANPKAVITLRRVLELIVAPLVVVLVIAVAGLLWRLPAMSENVSSNEKQIDKIEEQIGKLTDDLAALKARTAVVEVRAPDQTQAVQTPAKAKPEPSTPPCMNPTLNFKTEESVTPETPIKWRPSNCRMVIETWRHGNDCLKIGVTDSEGWDPMEARSCHDVGLQDVGVLSGEVTIKQIRGTQKGPIEIKIWVPHKGINKAVSVNVQ